MDKQANTPAVPPGAPPAAPGRWKHYQNFRKRTLSVGITAISWAAPGLMRLGFIRKPLAKSMEKHVRDSSRKQAEGGRMPPRVVADRMEIGVTILNTINRALAANRISRASIRRLLKTLGRDSLMKLGGWNARARFVEKFGVRAPEVLLISPTKVCNLRCKGCYADSTSELEKLSWPVLDRLVGEVHELWGGRFIVFSGGEPLAYKDEGHGVLDLAEKHPDCYFMMYTNSTLIDDATARRMGRLGNVMPAISIEGLKEKTDDRRGAGVFDQVVAAMGRLRRHKVFFGVSITATRENVEEILSDPVIDFYFKEQGALFAWLFHYMPIGRAITLDLMPTPEQRLWMWKRSWELIKDRRLFIADFWNGGTTARGCISAGRQGGYMAVVWNGDVVPCVFLPYSPVNINDAYANGKNLNDVWANPFFQNIRNWQNEYGYGKTFAIHTGELHNWMMPCPIRDHYKEFHPWLEEFKAKPIDENAREAMMDPEYLKGMADYNRRVAELLDPIWEKVYLDKDFKIPG
jgi:MoaA/NifB/PqqE/SkfB family radical SAM enzyme